MLKQKEKELVRFFAMWEKCPAFWDQKGFPGLTDWVSIGEDFFYGD